MQLSYAYQFQMMTEMRCSVSPRGLVNTEQVMLLLRVSHTCPREASWVNCTMQSFYRVLELELGSPVAIDTA